MSTLLDDHGRPLRLAVIGGGPESWIGNAHRTAAKLDGWFDVVAGVFSSDPARSREKGRQLGMPEGRSYGDLAELCARERARPDPVDAIAIMGPNDTHYPAAVAALDAGFDVMCDKPITLTLAEAQDLARRVAAGNRVYCITHGYSGYPMTRLARHFIHEGMLGPVRFVQVEYIQSGMALRLEDQPRTNRLAWLLDPARGGLALVLSAIGCHAQHLACFATDLRIAAVGAEVGALMPGRQVVDHVSANLRFDGGARGTFVATQAAAGAENDIRLRVYGEKGLLEWNHREASYLHVALQGEPARMYGRGDVFLPPEILALGRSPRGHPEGLREGFANLYREMAQDIMLRNLGRPRSTAPYPRITDGVHTMAFIDACIASHAADGRWTPVVG